jgi:hypothetical protein
MGEIHIWPEEHRLIGDQIQVNVQIEEAGKDQQQLWYRLGKEHRKAITESCDPFTLALLFKSMQAPADLIVHGQLSPSLLQNLEEFQSAWAAWKPETYSKIDILADEEVETPKLPRSAGVTAFSGGVDSSYTVYRHRSGISRRSRRDLRAGLMLLGLNLDLDKEDAFQRAIQQGQVMLDSMDMELIPMVTNLKSIAGSWLDSYGTIVGSCLSLLGGGFTYGLIPSEYSYIGLKFPWPINPVTDPYMSSESFKIIEDGAALLRFDKMGVISEWPEALQNLRVCFHPGDKHLNCSRCEKCIRTILGFRALGVGLPPSFHQDVSLSQIIRLKFTPSLQLEQYTDVVKTAQKKGNFSPWVLALRVAILKNKLVRTARKSNMLRYLWRMIHRS